MLNFLRLYQRTLTLKVYPENPGISTKTITKKWFCNLVLILHFKPFILLPSWELWSRGSFFSIGPLVSRLSNGRKSAVAINFAPAFFLSIKKYYLPSLLIFFSGANLCNARNIKYKSGKVVSLCWPSNITSCLTSEDV